MEVELVHVRSQNAVLRDDFDLNGQGKCKLESRDHSFSEIKKEQHKAMKELGANDILKAFDSEKDIETRFQTDFQKLLRGKTTYATSNTDMEHPENVGVQLSEFFKVCLNYIDVAVSATSLIEVTVFYTMTLPINPMLFRLLRIGKLVRAVRMVHMTNMLASLQLLVKCISASLNMLFWSESTYTLNEHF
eukprot:g26075.t1